MQKLICSHCFGYLLDHPELKNWKKCITCGYCENMNGYNKINIEPIQKEYKGCSCGAGTGEKNTCSCDNTI